MPPIKFYQAHLKNPKSLLQTVVSVFQVYFSMLDQYFQWIIDNKLAPYRSPYTSCIEDKNETHTHSQCQNQVNALTPGVDHKVVDT